MSDAEQSIVELAETQKEMVRIMSTVVQLLGNRTDLLDRLNYVYKKVSNAKDRVNS
jgi:hypothetical protein